MSECVSIVAVLLASVPVCRWLELGTGEHKTLPPRPSTLRAVAFSPCRCSSLRMCCNNFLTTHTVALGRQTFEMQTYLQHRMPSRTASGDSLSFRVFQTNYNQIIKLTNFVEFKKKNKNKLGQICKSHPPTIDNQKGNALLSL